MSDRDTPKPSRNADGALQAQLRELVGRNAHDFERLDEHVRALAEEHRERVYQELLRELSSVEMDHEKSLEHWQAVLDRQRTMVDRLGRPVDVRAAMLDWLLESQVLADPKIVELATLRRLEESVHRDGLTGLHNFRFFEEHLRRELAKSSRRMMPVSLAMVDIDHFKRFNDRFGHEAGNQALIAVSRVLSDALRGNDVCARYGGEEFALVLSDTPKPDAVEAMERLRGLIENECAELAGIELADSVTISVGVATFPADAVEPNRLVECADEALYASKNGGRNRVRAYKDGTRSFRRAPLNLEGSLHAIDDWQANILTSSVGDGGFSMQLDKELEAGTLLEVALRIPGRAETVSVAGRVAYARPDGDGSWETGIAIVEIGDDDRLLLSSVLDGAGDDLEPGGFAAGASLQA